MSAGDKRVRLLAEDLQIKAVTADTTETVAEAQRRHQASPTTTAAMGRVITAAALLGSTLKGSNRLTVFVNGDGPAGRLVATCDAQGNLRGYVQNPQAQLPPTADNKLDVAGVVGSGQLVASYDLGLGEPYSGSSPIISGEIGADVAYYLTTSEQIPSAVGLGVLVSGQNAVQAAGGFMIQALAEEESGDLAARRARVLEEIAERTSEINSISRMIDSGTTPEQLAKKFTEGLSARQIAKDELRFCCSCDQHRAGRILRCMNEEEIADILYEDGQVEITCEFCRTSYQFDAAEVEGIVSDD